MQCAMKHKGLMTKGDENSEALLNFKKLGTSDNSKYLHLCL